ncbi:MAG: hypothetical protein GWP19_01275 [Planctomycetia bacterium]|nr:hypothetical protein [Planctomycetia bacterium]
MIPLEISKSFIPVLKIIKGPSENISVLDFSRMMLGLSIIVWLIKDISNKQLLFYKDKIIGYLLLFIFYCLLSVLFVSSDLHRGFIELFRYFTYFLMTVICIRFINNKNDIELLYKFLLITGAILSIIGICEYFFGFHLWNEGVGLRSNTTFMDPNLYARFLSITLIPTIIFHYKRILFNNLTLNILISLQITALFVSVSRGGVLTFLIGLIFVYLFIERRIKVKLFPVILAIIVFIPIIFVILVKARGGGLTLFDIGQRVGLIHTGLKIYLDNLIFGIGIGSFETVALSSFSKFLPYGGRGVTLSHTSLVTIMAELGSMGLLIVFIIFYKILSSFKYLQTKKNEWVKTFSLIATTQIFIVLVASQSAGRMFEDPFLWFFIGVLISMKKMNDKLLTK